MKSTGFNLSMLIWFLAAYTAHWDEDADRVRYEGPPHIWFEDKHLRGAGTEASDAQSDAIEGSVNTRSPVFTWDWRSSAAGGGRGRCHKLWLVWERRAEEARCPNSCCRRSHHSFCSDAGGTWAHIHTQSYLKGNLSYLSPFSDIQYSIYSKVYWKVARRSG